MSMKKGSCLCDAISFEVKGKMGSADACHCKQCRKWTGHFLPSVEVSRDTLQVQGIKHLKWYHSSAKVRRGFCAECGSSLFFDPIDQQKHQWIAIALGAFDTPVDVKLGMHIFVTEKGNYYELNDGLPQNEH